MIAVYTGPSGSAFAFGALLVGLHDAGPGELRYAGKFGAGINETALHMILGHLKALETTQSPPANPARGYEAKGVHWVSPKLLVEVAYVQMTRESVVRHPVFHRSRTDNPPYLFVDEMSRRYSVKFPALCRRRSFVSVGSYRSPISKR